MNSANISSFFNCSLTAPQPTLDHCQWKTLNHSELLTGHYLLTQRLPGNSQWHSATRPFWAVIWFNYYILNTALRITENDFLQNCYRFQHTIINNTFDIISPWSPLQCTMILAEILHVHLDSSIQHLSHSNVLIQVIIHWD